MLSDEFPVMNILSPQSFGGNCVAIYMYVEDIDSVFNRAVSEGATVTMPLMDASWGDRQGSLADPLGYRWSPATHKKDLSDEEIEKGAKAAFAEMG